jgi:hypothetical protein
MFNVFPFDAKREKQPLSLRCAQDDHVIVRACNSPSIAY